MHTLNKGGAKPSQDSSMACEGNETDYKKHYDLLTEIINHSHQEIAAVRTAYKWAVTIIGIIVVTAHLLDKFIN